MENNINACNCHSFNSLAKNTSLTTAASGQATSTGRCMNSSDACATRWGTNCILHLSYAFFQCSGRQLTHSQMCALLSLSHSPSQNSPVYSEGQTQLQVSGSCVPPFMHIFCTQSRVWRQMENNINACNCHSSNSLAKNTSLTTAVSGQVTSTGRCMNSSDACSTLWVTNCSRSLHLSYVFFRDIDMCIVW